MAALTYGPGQTPIRENACRDVVESVLNLSGILDPGVALYGAQGALRLDFAECHENRSQRNLSGGLTYRLILTKGTRQRLSDPMSVRSDKRCTGYSKP